ncbi:MAG TPA: phytanoyl-CoA dioxygenase family protein [Acidimicrobiales bacterium]|nr:phytanoyl-CoA dioxygenase family protein [Acidimicrobiales bacterium]
MTTGTDRISDEHIAHWHEHGWVIVPDFLTPGELKEARENLERYFPSWEEYAAAAERYEAMPFWREFPYVGDALNNITTHPELIAFVEQALGTPDVFITQGLLWAKYAGKGDWEQDHHLDFGNNTLVVPRDDGAFRQVPMIVYYEDVTVDLGPTYVVSQTVTHTGGPLPMQLGREHTDAYAAEHPVTLTAGSLMIYSMATYHRGSAMKAASGTRFSHHIVWRRAGYEWMGFRAFPREGNTAEMKRFIEQATPRQRTVIGFPPPDHEYWNEATLAGVAARYPGMDMGPYCP